MGLTNVIVRTGNESRKLRYSCLDLALPVNAGANIECPGSCEECGWWNRRTHPRAVSDHAVSDVGEVTNCELIKSLGFAIAAPDIEKDDESSREDLIERSSEQDECDGGGFVTGRVHNVAQLITSILHPMSSDVTR